MHLGVERQEKYNRTNEPCGHSFRDCIDNFMAKNAGCQLLENKRKTDLPKCKTLDEIRMFEEIYHLLMGSTNKGFKKLTGCLSPCTYMKYIVIYRQRMSDQFGVQLGFAAAELTVKKEVKLIIFKFLQELLYPFSSFLAEFGGALGLFLGFSFAMLWDLVIASIAVLVENPLS